MPESQALIGRTISHYRILESLGMGVAYKAEDVKLRRYMALIFIPDNGSQNARALTQPLAVAKQRARKQVSNQKFVL